MDLIFQIIMWIGIAVIFCFVIWALMGIAKIFDESSDEYWERNFGGKK